jgi:hypothetical protein
MLKPFTTAPIRATHCRPQKCCFGFPSEVWFYFYTDVKIVDHMINLIHGNYVDKRNSPKTFPSYDDLGNFILGN